MEWLVVRIPAMKSSLYLMENQLGGQKAPHVFQQQQRRRRRRHTHKFTCLHMLQSEIEINLINLELYIATVIHFIPKVTLMTLSSVGELIHWEGENISRRFITYIDNFKGLRPNLA